MTVDTYTLTQTVATQGGDKYEIETDIPNFKDDECWQEIYFRRYHDKTTLNLSYRAHKI